MIIYSKPLNKKPVLNEGGADMRLVHLYDDFNLSLDDIKNLLNVIKQDKFVGTEKIDGYNLKITYREQEVFVARNKKEIEIGGLNIDGLLAKNFNGGKEVKEVFINAYQALEELFLETSELELQKCFPEHQNLWLNCEIVSSKNNNFLKYDKDWILFHSVGSAFYELDSSKKITGANYSPYYEYFIELIKDKKIESWRFGPSPNFKFSKSISPKVWDEIDLIEKIYSSNSVPTSTSFAGLAKVISPNATATETKEILSPIRESLFNIGALLLKGEDSSLITNSDSSVRESKKLLEKAISSIKAYEGNDEKIKSAFEKNMSLLKSANNFDSTLEGVVFNYGSKFYKITGFYSPANQIINLYNIITKNKESDEPIGESLGDWFAVPSNIAPDQEENLDGRITFLYPGAFKPPHLGHFDAMQNILNAQYGKKINKFIVIISNKSRFTDRNGIEIDAYTSKYIWEVFARNFENVEIRLSKFDTPIKDIYDFIEHETEQNDKIYIVKSEKDKEDKRFSKIDKFAEEKDKKIKISEVIAPEYKGVSSTIIRNALDSYNPSSIFDYMPPMTKAEKHDIWNRIFKKKAKKNESSEFTVLNEISPVTAKKIYDFIDSLNLMDKEQWIEKLSYNHIFDNRTRLVFPLSRISTVESPERLTEICFDCGWILNMGQGVVTKEVGPKVHQVKLTKFLNRLINITGGLANYNTLSQNKKNKILKDLFFYTDYDVPEFQRKFGDYMKFISELSSFKEQYIREMEDDFNRYSIVLSRHPIDITRMGDHATMKTCFGDENDKIFCAIEDARVNGLVSYIVLTEQLKQFNLDSDEFQKDEIFKDPDRGVNGIVPVSRIRILRLINDQEAFEMAIPETNVYGKFKDEHYQAVKRFLQNAQDSYLHERIDFKKLKAEHLYFTGGHYIDSPLENIVDSYFDTTKFSKSRKKIHQPALGEEERNSYIFREASKWINRRQGLLKYNKEYIKNVGFTIDTMNIDSTMEEFCPTLKFTVTAPYEGKTIDPEVKTKLINKLSHFDKNVSIVQSGSDLDIINGDLILTLTVTFNDFLRSGFEQVMELESLLKIYSDYLDKINFKEKISKLSKVSKIENIDVQESIEDDDILELTWEKPFYFRKFIVPGNFEPEIENRTIEIPANLLKLDVEYSISMIEISYVEYNTEDYIYFSESIEKMKDNTAIGNYKIMVKCNNEDFPIVKDAFLEHIKVISEKLSNYIEKSFMEVEKNSVLDFLDSIEEQKAFLEPDSVEFNFWEKLKNIFINFYDLNGNNSEFIY